MKEIILTLAIVNVCFLMNYVANNWVIALVYVLIANLTVGSVLHIKSEEYNQLKKVLLD